MGTLCQGSVCLSEGWGGTWCQCSACSVCVWGGGGCLGVEAAASVVVQFCYQLFTIVEMILANRQTRLASLANQNVQTNKLL